MEACTDCLFYLWKQLYNHSYIDIIINKKYFGLLEKSEHLFGNDLPIQERCELQQSNPWARPWASLDCSTDVSQLG